MSRDAKTRPSIQRLESTKALHVILHLSSMLADITHRSSDIKDELDGVSISIDARDYLIVGYV